MSRTNQIVLGLVVIIGIIAGLYFWYRSSFPTQADIDAAAVKIETIDPNILSSQTVKTVSTMSIYGPMPVEVKPEEVGRDNPFSNY